LLVGLDGEMGGMGLGESHNGNQWHGENQTTGKRFPKHPKFLLV
jgi:hypothetical protein